MGKFRFLVSRKRGLEITKAKQKVAGDTGVPASKGDTERKIGSTRVKLIFGKK